jgi:hypothetical protein
MADELNPAAAPAPAPDGGADPALELPGGQPAANPDPNADPAEAGASPPADPAAAPTADPADPAAEPAGKERVRFSEMSKMVRQAVQAAEESKRQLAQAISALDRVAPQPTAAPAVPQDEEPPAPVFETPEQYQRDMAAYARRLAEITAKRQVQTERAEVERQRAEQEQLARTNKVREAYQQRRAAAMEKYPDFTEVAESPDVHITVPMAHAITLAPHGTEVQYFLGKNTAEAERIAALEPALQLIEIGMLAAKLSTPKTPTRTQAPAPIKPLGGASTPATKSPDEMSMDEYAAMRSKR